MNVRLRPQRCTSRAMLFDDWLNALFKFLTFTIIIYLVVVDTCMSQHAANHTSYISQLRSASQCVGDIEVKYEPKHHLLVCADRQV